MRCCRGWCIEIEAGEISSRAKTGPAVAGGLKLSSRLLDRCGVLRLAILTSGWIGRAYETRTGEHAQGRRLKFKVLFPDAPDIVITVTTNGVSKTTNDMRLGLNQS